jgi:GNAT superfamily N-acetyltransferase
MSGVDRDGADAPRFRPARADDLDALIAIFAGDALGGHGDTVDPEARPSYAAAMTTILASPSDHLFVGEIEGHIVATAQLSFVTALPHRGRRRAIVEAVQVVAERRGEGIGAELMAFLIDEARAGGAGVVELTSNAARVDAHRFYERLGFTKSHVGFKLAPDADRG